MSRDDEGGGALEDRQLLGLGREDRDRQEEGNDAEVLEEQDAHRELTLGRIDLASLVLKYGPLPPERVVAVLRQQDG